jgi:hypothetical protein
LKQSQDDRRTNKRQCSGFYDHYHFSKRGRILYRVRLGAGKIMVQTDRCLLPNRLLILTWALKQYGSLAMEYQSMDGLFGELSFVQPPAIILAHRWCKTPWKYCHCATSAPGGSHFFSTMPASWRERENDRCQTRRGYPGGHRFWNAADVDKTIERPGAIHWWISCNFAPR